MLVRRLALAVLLAAAPVSAHATPIALLDIAAAGFVGQTQQGPLDQPVLVESYAEFTTVFGASTAGLANPYMAPSAAAFFVNGGQDLWVVRTIGVDDASLIGVDGGAGSRTGLQAIRDVPTLGAVAIPGVASTPVQTAMIALCESMGDRIAILDPVSMTDPNAVITQRSTLATMDGFATLYFPWVVAAPAGTPLTLPPSGFVAGIFASTSPPDSPAGPGDGFVTTATDVSYTVSSTLQNTLNPLGIDAIRYFSGLGVLLFGARTLASDAEWQYIATRRAAIDIEESIDIGTAWALNEPNDATLWAQLRSDVEDFMQTLFQSGWFQGASANDAYFVRCNLGTSMTSTDVIEGRTIIQVGFAPETPAEFVVLEIVHQRPGPVSVPLRTHGLALNAPRPNPASTGTTLSFQLPRAEPVTLRILDVAGRNVRTLVAGERLAAGNHQRHWDGRNEFGAAMGAGIYFARLSLAGASASMALLEKIVLTP